ncbi:MAG: SIS domain-containing protein, partial [Promethearchaeota archaeon]
MNQKEMKLGEKTRLEIYQEPNAIRNALDQQDYLKEIAEKIHERDPKLIILTGSGTSYHSACAAMYFLHVFARIPSYAIHPSDFPYFTKYILDQKIVVILISQSGESSDTIEAGRIADSKGSLIIPIVNEPNSTLAKLHPENTI